MIMTFVMQLLNNWKSKVKMIKISNNEQKLLLKIDNANILSNNDIEYIINNCLILEQDEEYLGIRVKNIESIVQIGNRTFKIYWMQGTFDQHYRCFFPEQHPIEVQCIRKMVEVKKWIPIDCKNTASNDEIFER